MKSEVKSLNIIGKTNYIVWSFILKRFLLVTLITTLKDLNV